MYSLSNPLKKISRIFFFSLSFAFLSPLAPLTSLFAQEGEWVDVPKKGSDIYLVTLGAGDLIFELWGHQGILLVNAEYPEGVFYDYGNFDFTSDNFFPNFLRGRLYYSGNKTGGSLSARRLLEYYRTTLKRSIYFDKLNLTTDETKRLIQLLERSVAPENRVYLYHVYLKNCATVLRDMLDVITKSQFQDDNSEMTDQTFRRLFRQSTYPSVLYDLLLDFIQGNSIDRPISQWEALFLPEILQERVGDIQFTNSEGEEVPLISEHIVYSSQRYLPQHESPNNYDVPALIGGLLLALASLFASLFAYQKRWVRRVWGLVLIPLVVVTTLVGSVGFFMAFFSDHTYSHSNLNILLFNPLVALFIPAYLRLCKRGEWRSFWVGNLFAILFLIALLLHLFPQIYQHQSHFLLFTGPSYLLFCGPVYTRVRRLLMKTLFKEKKSL